MNAHPTNQAAFSTCNGKAEVSSVDKSSVCEARSMSMPITSPFAPKSIFTPSAISRVSVPVYQDGVQVGKATSTTWSPTLKKMIALATLDSDAATVGTTLEYEFTVDHKRKAVGATVASLPFFDPPRKRT